MCQSNADTLGSLCIDFATVFFALVTSLAMGPRQVAVFDHVLCRGRGRGEDGNGKRCQFVVGSQTKLKAYSNLPFHCDEKQGDKVEQENRPEDGNIAELKEGAHHCDQGGFSG